MSSNNVRRTLTIFAKIFEMTMYDEPENESKSKKVKNGVQPENRKNPIFDLWHFQHTNRKLLTRRKIKLLTVKRHLDRLGRYDALKVPMYEKNQTFYF
jgi:hypothetical protein